MARGIKLEMNWLPLQSRKGCPLGLKNLGNSCYLNSVLQCLTYTPPLANFCLRNHHSSSCTSSNGIDSSICLFCLVEKRIARSLSIDSVSESPAKIHSCLSLFAKHFREGWQEDAHEFLQYVIEACNNVCVKLHKILSASKLRTRQDSQKLLKEEPHTVVKEIFGGVLQSQVKCLTCKAESNKLDEMMDLSLDVFKLASLKDALCRFFQPEVLDGSNKYKCEKCKKLTAARKQMSVSQAPNVLVIQFKRFENFYGGKIDRHISFEEDLELHSHMCRESQDRRPEYCLYGVIVHAGYSQDCGHYYSYVKDSHGKWYCCNDAYVTSVTAKSVLSEKAYVLFYVRRTIKPVVSGTAVFENGFATGTGKENGKVVVSLKEMSVKENGVTEKSSSSSKDLDLKENGVSERSSSYRKELAAKENGVTKKLHCYPKELSVKENCVIEKSISLPKELAMKENGVSEKSNICSKELVLKENAVVEKSDISLGPGQPVRFNIGKSGSNGHPGKLFGNGNRSTGQAFMNVMHSKTLSNPSPASSEGNKANQMNSIMETAVLNKQEPERPNSSTSYNNLSNDYSSSKSNHELSLVERNVSCPGALFSEDEKHIKGLSNGSHFERCSSEELLSSCSCGPKSQSVSVQKLLTIGHSSDESERKDKPETALSNGEVAGNLPDRHLLLSREVSVEPATKYKALTENAYLEGSNRGDLELRLAAESREWLLQSGWCDTVRNSFRQLKRARSSQSDKSSDNKRKTIRIEVFANVHDSLRQKVPKELKEHLVKQLQEYFACQKVKKI